MNPNSPELKQRKRWFGRAIRVHSCPFVVAPPSSYRGRLAPSPTGHLHLGHARTFWIAAARARAAGGALVLRNEDLDAIRFRMDFDVLEAIGAPHEGAGADDEPVYPLEFRPPPTAALPPLGDTIAVNWRLRVPEGKAITFTDSRAGEQRAVAGRDFGDFLVWRKDDVPSYQLACAVDDSAMGITEVVRGDDLIKSTFRQLLVYRALGLRPPRFFHCPLMLDDRGERLAKRHDALSLRTLRAQGVTPAEIIAKFAAEVG